MGRIIDLAEYRTKHKGNRLDGVYMESHPPYIIFRFFEKGVLVRESRILSERMMREHLDSLP